MRQAQLYAQPANSPHTQDERIAHPAPLPWLSILLLKPLAAGPGNRRDNTLRCSTAYRKLKRSTIYISCYKKKNCVKTKNKIPHTVKESWRLAANRSDKSIPTRPSRLMQPIYHRPASKPYRPSVGTAEMNRHNGQHSSARRDIRLMLNGQLENFRRAAVSLNAAGIILTGGFMASLTPYYFGSDCSAAYGASLFLPILRVMFVWFSAGAVFAVLVPIAVTIVLALATIFADRRDKWPRLSSLSLDVSTYIKNYERPGGFIISALSVALFLGTAFIGIKHLAGVMTFNNLRSLTSEVSIECASLGRRGMPLQGPPATLRPSSLGMKVEPSVKVSP
jgi:hypothetical protein